MEHYSTKQFSPRMIVQSDENITLYYIDYAGNTQPQMLWD